MVLRLLMFKNCVIIGISKIDFFNFSGTERVKPLGPCKSEILKKLKSSRLQIFFKIPSIKDFAIFAGKHLCWGLFFIKLQV